ncbi:MAG TPA: hypothetical protein VGB17_10460 [Pyrinomonadaceae bacterium]|jgi:uncharacterized membrane protein
MAKKTKYDTNPLDPDYVRRTEEVRGATEEIPAAGGATQEQAQTHRGVDTEAPTHHLNAPHTASYPSVFIPATYQPPQTPAQRPAAQPVAATHAPTSQTVPGISLPENIALILPYIPFPLIGTVPGLLELLLVPRHQVRVRFHAAQGLALHLFVLIVSALFSTASSIASALLRGPASFLLALASSLFTIAAFIFFIISMIRVWKGEAHVITPLADAAKWLNEKLEPKK